LLDRISIYDTAPTIGKISQSEYQYFSQEPTITVTFYDEGLPAGKELWRVYMYVKNGDRSTSTPNFSSEAGDASLVSLTNINAKTWTHDKPVPDVLWNSLSDGICTVYFKAIDEDYNEQGENAESVDSGDSTYSADSDGTNPWYWRFYKDTTAPTYQNGSPGSTVWSNSTTVSCTIEVVDALSGVDATTIDYTVSTTGTTGFSVDWTSAGASGTGNTITANVSPTFLEGNDNYIKWRAKDVLHNGYSESSPIRVKIDTSTPTFSNPVPASTSWQTTTTLNCSITITDPLLADGTDPSNVDVSTVQYAISTTGTTGYGAWTDANSTVSDGQQVTITVNNISFANGTNNYIKWRVKDIAGNGYAVSADYQIKIDTDSLSYSNPSPGSSTWQTSTSVDVSIDIADSTSGIDVSTVEYKTSTNGTASYGSWLSAESTVSDANSVTITKAGLSFADGTLNYIKWRARDVAGNNWVESTDYQIKIDISELSYSSSTPSSSTWNTNTTVSCGITLSDSLSGVDTSTIDYAISTTGTTGFGTWQTASCTLSNGNSITWNVSPTFADGTDNYIKWRAKDVVGNGYTISNNYQIKVDTQAPTYSDPYPTTQTWVTENGTCSVHVNDSISMVDASTIEYKISTTGTTGYGNWQSAGMSLDDSVVVASVNVTLADGNDNYIKWRAKDLAGNGYSESPDYNIKVDTSLGVVRFTQETPMSNDWQNSTAINFTVVANKGGTYDVDADTIEYAISTTGLGGYGTWQNAGETVDGSSVNVSVSVTFAEGQLNYIKFRAKDVNGGGPASSPDYNIKIDLTPPTLSNPDPAHETWVNTTTPTCSIQIEDGTGVGIEPATVEYAQSTNGTSNYSAWTNAYDMVVSYNFDMSSGTVLPDNSGNGCDATVYNAKWVASRRGNALSFDGNNDYCEDPDGETNLNGKSAITFTVWVKSNTDDTDSGIFIGKDPNGDDTALTLRYDKAGWGGGGTKVIKCGITTTGGSTQIESSSYKCTTDWQFLAMTWSSGNSIKLYINGQLDTLSYDQGAVTGTVSGNTKFLIGKGTKDTGTSCWNGLIDDLRIYSRVLTQQEIQDIYNESTTYRVTLSLAEGENNYLRWRAKDLVDNGFSYSQHINIKVDITPLSFSNPTPSSSVYQNSTNVTCGITLTDNLSGVDASTIEYRYSTTGLGGYGAWISAECTLTDYTTITWNVTPAFAEGTNNYIKWRAKDVAGNGWTESSDYQIKVDITDVTYSNMSPTSSTWNTSNSVNVSIDVQDSASGVDASTILYCISTTGSTTGYGAWQNAGETTDGATVNVGPIAVTFENGTDNYIKWSAKDLAGNLIESTPYQIKVDSLDPVYANFVPSSSSWQTTQNVVCTIEVTDTDGMGVDASTLQYAISTTGTAGFGAWQGTCTESDGELVRWSFTVNFGADGDDNYIKFKCQDLTGRAAVESSPYLVKIDTTGPTFSNATPPSSETQVSPTMICSVTITDSQSSVDASTIEYAYSTSGTTGYGAWNSANMTIDGTEVIATTEVTFADGINNYIKWRAKDLVGNGYTVSGDYQIKVDTSVPPDLFLKEYWEDENNNPHTLATNGWTGPDYYVSSIGQPKQGLYYGANYDLNRSSLTSKTFDLTNAVAPTLRYSCWIGDVEENVYLEYYDGSSWNIIESYRDNNGYTQPQSGTWLDQNFEIDMSTYNISNFRFRWRDVNTEGGDDFAVDKIIFYDAAPVLDAIPQTENQWYNTPPTLNLCFKDDPYSTLASAYYAVKSGDTDMATPISFTQEISTNLSGTQWSTTWTLPQADFDALAEGIATIYFKCSDSAGYSRGANKETTPNNWFWRFKKDTTLPSFSNESPTSTSFQGSATVTCSVQIDDGGSGVDASTIYYRYSTTGTTGYGSWIQVTGYTDGATVTPGVSVTFADGNDNYIQWKVKDKVGNGFAQSNNYQIKVDLTGPTYGTQTPSSGVWQTSKVVNCGITIYDTDGSSVSASTLEYSISTDGTLGFGAWQSAGCTAADGVTVTWSMDIDFGTYANGSDNYIRWRAKDVLGNGYTVSDIHNIKIDTIGPSYSNQSPLDTQWSANAQVTCQITVSDETSFVDVSTAQYSITTNGTANYGPWYDVGSTASDASTVTLSVSPTFTSGTNNYIRWRVKDVAGNNYTVSSDYQIKIDCVSPTFANFLPASSTWNLGLTVPITIEVHDIGGRGVDASTIEYAISETGTTGYGAYQNAGKTDDAESITVTLNPTFSEGTDNYIKFKASDLMGNGPSYSIDYQIKVDVTAPSFSNPQPTSSEIQGSTSVTCRVDINDGVSGVDASTIEYAVSTTGTTGYGAWQSAGEAVDATLITPQVNVTFADGNNNYIKWRAKDVAGNGYAVSPDYQIKVNESLEVVYFNNATPDSATWNGNTTVNCTIDVDWKNSINVDASSIEYRISTNGIDNYGTWQNAGETVDGTRVSCSVNPTFASGTNNYIQWRAMNVNGDGPTNSPHYQIKVDVNNVTYANFTPASSTYTNNATLQCDIDVQDIGERGVDASSIKYRISTNGTGNYGSWQNAGAVTDGETVHVTLTPTFAEGNDNYIQFRADDLQGHLDTLSGHYLIRVDLTNPTFNSESPVSGSWSNVASFNVSVTADDTGGTGGLIDASSIEYAVSTGGVGNYSAWQSAGVTASDASTIVVTVTPTFIEGTNNYIKFRTKDVAGNGYAVSSDYNYKVDLTEVTFSNPSPSSTVYQTTLTPTCGISVEDSLSMVDGSTIQYKISTNGTLNYGAWTDADFTIDGTNVRPEVTPTFVNGDNNYIKWRAKDIAGNGYTESGDYQIKIDAAPCYFESALPGSSSWQTSTTVTCSITVKDDLTGVDASTIEYCYSTTGTTGYGAWTSAGKSIDGTAISCSVDLTFVNGTNNYIKWRAKDLAGNGPAESADYQIKVDVAEVTFSDNSPTGWNASTMVTCTVKIQDTDGSGVDADTIQYRYSTAGVGNYGSWTNAGYTNDGETINASVTLTFVNGSDNYIQWQAKDLVGHGWTASNNYNIKVDTTYVAGIFFEDDFESGSFATNSWTKDNGSGTINLSTTTAAQSESYWVRFAGDFVATNGKLSKTLDLSTKNTVVITFYYWIGDLENGKNVRWQFWDGTQWDDIQVFTNQDNNDWNPGPWTQRSYIVNMSTYGISGFKFRWLAEFNDNKKPDEFGIDTVKVYDSAPTMDTIPQAEYEYYNQPPSLTLKFKDQPQSLAENAVITENLDSVYYAASNSDGNDPSPSYNTIASSINATEWDNGGSDWTLPTATFNSLSDGVCTIYFKAKDDYGTEAGYGVSDYKKPTWQSNWYFRFYKDTTAISSGSYSNFSPTGTQSTVKLDVSVTITDTPSVGKVDVSTIEYAISTTGTTGYGTWISAECSAADANQVTVTLSNLTFADGSNNYIKFRARDVVDNGWGVSNDYNIVINSTACTFSSPVPNSGQWQNSSSLTSEVTITRYHTGTNVDASTVEYCISTSGTGAYGTWQSAGESTDATQIVADAYITLAEGTDNYIKWRAKDTDGNGYTESSDYQIKIDLTGVTYANPTPSSSVWQSSTTLNCGIDVNDALSGVDGSTIQYKTSTNGITNYGAWQDAGITNDGATVSATVSATFTNGDTNYIKWRAKDIVGNSYVESSDYQIKIDVMNPSFTANSPSSTVWQTSTTVLCGVTIEDLHSGVDASTIQYCYSTTGTTGFGTWNNILYTPQDGVNVYATAEITFVDGTANYIKWRVQDVAGNGDVESPEYQIKVDTTGPTYSNPTPTSWKSSVTVTCGITVNDSGAGVDASTIEYRYSTSGTTGYGAWISAEAVGDAASIDVSRSITFADGTNNYVQWRAKDVLSNGWTYSEHNQVLIDVSLAPVTFNNPTPSSSTWLLTTEVTCGITIEKAMASDVDASSIEYRISTNGTGNYGAWQNAGYTTDAATIEASINVTFVAGSNNYIQWRADNTTNDGPSESPDYQIKIDLNEVSYSGFSPSSSVWQTTTTPDISITISDGTESGVDASTIEYAISTNGTANYGAWQNAGYTVDSGSIVVNLTPTFSDGINNYIKFKAGDLSGHGPTVSSDYQIKVDATPVSYSNASPSSTTWNTSTTVTCQIRISDATSQVDASTIDYRFSINGTGNYGAWQNAGYTIDGSPIDVTVDIGFASSTDNYIQWRAKDIAGNGYTLSSDYQIKVDADNVTFTNFSPTSSEWFSSPSVSCSVDVNDAVSGVDADTIEFQISTNGTGAYGTWQNAGQTTDGTLVATTISATFAHGTDNYVRFRANDVAGSGLALSSDYQVKIDTEGPTYSSPSPASTQWSTSTTVNCQVTISDNGMSGVDKSTIEYAISTTGTTGYGTWTSLGVSGTAGSYIAQKSISFVEGTNNYIKWRAKDVVKNDYTVSGDYQVKIDTTPVSFSSPSPDASTTMTTTEVTCSITVTDSGSQVDASTIEYCYSTTGTTGYGAWQNAGATLDGTQVVASVSVSFSDSLTNNYIKWRAKDIAGNGYTESSDYIVKVDTTGAAVDYSNESPQAGFWVTSVNQTCSVQMDKATTTQIDGTTIKYRYSTNGIANYGAWQSAGETGQADQYIPSVSLTFAEGTTNYIQWQGDKVGGSNPNLSNDYQIKIDTTNPYFESNTPATWINYTSNVSFGVTVKDDVSGIDASTLQYRTTTTGTANYSGWINAGYTTDASTIVASLTQNFAEGTNNYHKWRVKDIAGNGYIESSDFQIKIDLTNPAFTQESPTSTTWQNSEIVSCQITINDNESGVDASTIQYAYSTSGTTAYSGWTSANQSVDGTSVTPIVTVTFVSGTDNYIKWRTKDVASNGYVESSDYQIKVDAVNPTFSNPLPQNTTWQTSEPVTCQIDVSDSLSGVDASTIEYAVSASGSGGPYSAWQSAGETADATLISASISTSDFVDGVDNYIKWRAKDVAGNGYAESSAYQIKLDATPPTFSSPSPDSSTFNTSTTVTCGITVEDPHSQVDASTIEYCYSTSGTANYGGWTNAGVSVNGTIVVVTKDITFVNGIDNYIKWRAKNLAGSNYAESSDINVKVDVDSVTYSNMSPTSSEWMDSVNVVCSVQVKDINGSGVDASTIEYCISTTGTTGYGAWQNAGETVDGEIVTASITETFANGTNNYIKWRAKDLVGHGPTESPDYQILIDTATAAVTFTDETPSSSEWQSSTNVTIGVTIEKNGASQIDASTIEYRISTNGTGNYGAWQNAGYATDADTIQAQATVTFVAGTNNYFQWQAKNTAGKGPTTSVDFQVKIDVNNVTFESPLPASTTWNTTTSPSCSITIKDVDESGVDGSTVQYAISTNGTGNYGAWQDAGYTLDGQTVTPTVTPTFAEGTNNYIKWQAKDLVGHGYTVSDDYQIKVDSTSVSFVNAQPASTVWQSSTAVLCSISCEDTTSGVDISTIEYQISTNGTSNYGIWSTSGISTVAAAGNKSVRIEVTPSFADGDANYIKYRAKDAAGNNYTISSDYQIKVDTTNPTFSNPAPASTEWQTTTEVTCSIDISDTLSGVDVSTVEYKYSTSGLTGYGSWMSAGATVSDANLVTISKTISFVDQSDQNYVKWRAKDLVGNGWAVSNDYQIKVDTSNIACVYQNPSPSSTVWQTSTTVSCSVVLTRENTSAALIDSSTIQYRISTSGTVAYGTWNNLAFTPADAESVTATCEATFSDGTDNYIQWQAKNLDNKGPTLSGHYKLIIDSTPVYYTNFGPTATQESTTVSFSIEVNDATSGVDVTSGIQYCFSTTGTGNYGAWKNATVTGSDGDSVVVVEGTETFASGTNNYVKFRAKDVAGNGWTESADYQIKIQSAVAAPVVSAAETCDLDSDGYIDAIKITFDKAMDDSTITGTDFDVSGVGGETFSSTTNGDVADNEIIYIQFNDGVLDTGATPTISYSGSPKVKSLDGGVLEDITSQSTTDKAPPVFTSVQPATNGEVNHAMVTYTLSEDLNTGTITYTRTGGSADAGSPHTYNLTVAQKSKGTHSSVDTGFSLVTGAYYTVSFDGSDSAGNNATTVSSTNVLYDKAAPSSTITSPTDAGYYNSLTQFTGTSADTGGSDVAFVEISVKNNTTNKWYDPADSAPNKYDRYVKTSEYWFSVSGTLSWTYDSTGMFETNTQYTIRVRAQDQAGNTQISAIDSNTCWYDTTAPTLSLFKAGDGTNQATTFDGTEYLQDTSIVLSVEVTEAVKVNSVKAYYTTNGNDPTPSDTELVMTTSDSGSPYTYTVTIPDTAVADGNTVKFKVYCTDEATNTVVSIIKSFKIDGVPPSSTVTSASDGTNTDTVLDGTNYLKDTDINIEAEVTEAVGLSQVKIYYTTDGSTPTTASPSANMSTADGSSPYTYTGTIPETQIADGDTVKFKIWSQDTVGYTHMTGTEKVFKVDGSGPSTITDLFDMNGRYIMPLRKQIIKIRGVDAVKMGNTLTLKYWREGVDDLVANGGNGNGVWDAGEEKSVVMNPVGTVSSSTVFTCEIDDSQNGDNNTVIFWVEGTDHIGNPISAAVGGSGSSPFVTYTTWNFTKNSGGGTFTQSAGAIEITPGTTSSINKFYVADKTGKVYALDKSGNPKLNKVWEFTANSSLIDRILVYNFGTPEIYFATDTGRVYKLIDNGASCTDAWAASPCDLPATPIMVPFLISGSNFLVICNNGLVYKRNRSDGTAAGSVDLSSYGTPTAASIYPGTYVLVGFDTGWVVKLTVNPLAISDAKDLTSDSIEAPLGYVNSNFTPDPRVATALVKDSNGSVMAIKLTDLSQQWATYEAGAALTSGFGKNLGASIGSESISMVGDINGKLHHINLADGTDFTTEASLCDITPGYPIRTTPLYYNGDLFFGSDNGYVFKLRYVTGEFMVHVNKWPMKTGGPVKAFPVRNNNTVLVGSTDGNAYSFEEP